MNQEISLGLTLVLGLFILLGSAIVFITKNSNTVVNFSISMALGVMTSLGIFELLPESYEHLEQFHNLKIPVMFGTILIGILFLTFLDQFIPDHHLENHTEKEEKENLHHIGLVSSIALVLHNMIEGMAIYSTVTTDMKLGLFMCIGVGLHNIPLGMVITSTFYKSNNSIKKTLWISLFISISTFLGGMIMYLLSNIITDAVLGILLSITLGMLFYIICFELIPHIKENWKEKTTVFGVVFGIIIFFLSKLF